MTDKQTYWMADVDGTKAFVTGADERDRLIPLGWAVADEPASGDFVWLEHDEHGGRAKFTADAVPLWEPRGWHPSPPEEPVNPALPNLAAATAAPPAKTPAPEPAADVKPETPAKTKNEKE